MKKATLTILDPVYSCISKNLIEAISKQLSYEYEYWVQRQYSKEKKMQGASMVDKKGYVLTGFVPYIKKYCKRKKIQLTVENLDGRKAMRQIKKVKVKGIVFREDQEMLIGRMAKGERGVILSATGTGKTLLTMALINLYPGARVLFLCHNIWKFIAH